MGFARGIKNPGFIEGTKALAASATLTALDAGKIILFDSTTSVVATLPKSSQGTKGRYFHFQVKQLTAASGHTVTPNSADFLHFKNATGAPSAGQSAQCSAATDAYGDGISFYDNGDGNYYQVEIAGTWAKV